MPTRFPSFSENELFQKLRKLKQDHLLAHWNNIAPQKRGQLLRQVEHLNEELLEKLQANLKMQREEPPSLEPFNDYVFRGSKENRERGYEAIEQGKCACLTVAGGQGSRLRFPGPKGCFPISLIKSKSLFQIVAEKIKAAGKKARRELHWAIMTSPLNHVETETFFDSQGFFGLSPSKVHFFYQDLWPLLDFQGNLFLDAPDHLAEGPNGNGGALRRLVQSGILNRLKSEGVELLSFVPIDNPLADPFDAELFGTHLLMKNEATSKAALRKNLQGKVGIFAKKNGKLGVVEYSEFPEDLIEKKAADDYLFPVANLSLFSFSLSFIERVGSLPLPFHKALKAVKKWDEKGESFPFEPNAWKFEEFIFDALAYAERFSVLIYPKEETFAPLKNFSGPDSIEAVQAALQMADRKAFFRVSGIELPPDLPIEVAQDFYYPTDHLIQKWKGKVPDQAYIEGL